VSAGAMDLLTQAVLGSMRDFGIRFALAAAAPVLVAVSRLLKIGGNERAVPRRPGDHQQQVLKRNRTAGTYGL